MSTKYLHGKYYKLYTKYCNLIPLSENVWYFY